MKIHSRLSSIIIAACVAGTTVFAADADFTIGFIRSLTRIRISKPPERARLRRRKKSVESRFQ